MANKHVIASVLLAAGVLAIAACASQPASTTASLDDRYFEREANNYLKFEHQYVTVYCQNDRAAATLVPYKQCVTETQLRRMVEVARRSRNAVQPALVAGTGQGGIGDN